MDGLNEKIYENVKKHNEFFMTNNSENKIIDPQIYDLKKDFEVNRSFAELKEREKSKNNSFLIEQRLQEVAIIKYQIEKQKELDFKLKQEKLDNQRIYRNLLDNQVLKLI